MIAPLCAITWEIWGANRRSWLLVLVALPVFGLFYFLIGQTIGRSDALEALAMLPVAWSLILLLAIFNFSERHRRKGIDGFPQRLFLLPVRTSVLVICPMLCGVLSLIALYIAWTELVFRPLGMDLLVRWPAMLLAAAMVFYQTIMWCLSGFRITRLITLSVALPCLLAVGFWPYLLDRNGDLQLEAMLTAGLAFMMVVSYVAAVIAVSRQRRGGGRGWQWMPTLVQSLADAIPRPRGSFSLPQRALLWIEWRRSGWMLPVTVLLGFFLIVAANSWLVRDHTKEGTALVTTWISILPILLAVPISKGIAKPGFWSLNLSLPTFDATRPVTSGQMIAAKMKTAAISTVLAWAVLLVVMPIWLYLFRNTERLTDTWRIIQMIYSPTTQWALPAFGLLTGMLLTWSVMVASIWAGYSGRSAWYFASVGLSVLALSTSLAIVVLCSYYPEKSDVAVLWLLGWIPWALAAAFIFKIWTAVWSLSQAHRRGLISNRAVGMYLCFWLAATSCVVLLAWSIAPKVEWLRNLLMLAALLAIPAARVGTAPLMAAWNRHR